MLSHKYTSMQRVLENVIRDTGFTEEIDFVESIEWAYRAMELIGAPQIYIEKVTDGNRDLNHIDPLIVEDYRTELPADLHHIIQVRSYGNKEALTEAKNSFHSSNHMSDEGNTIYTNYRIDNGWLFTNFKDGALEVAYYAFPTDSEGYPAIPDDERYLKAVESYIIERTGRKLWLKDKLSREKYNALEMDWLFYVRGAKSRTQMPTIDGMESFKNQILRLITHPDRHSHGFIQQGDPEQLRVLKNRFGRTG